MNPQIQKLLNHQNLTQSEMEDVMRAVISSQLSKDDVASFLLTLRSKGPTVEEITGAAKVLRENATRVQTKHKVILDTCGTGGDKKNTFNISTVTAFVVAGAGVAVAKHGNRSVSSRCGSADILEALGIKLEVGEKHLSTCLNELGIAFLFAQSLHPAMRSVAAVRKELKVETIFNILGPLANPARATHQMMGVYSRDLVEPVAHVLQNLGLKKALVVHGNDGLDEITLTDRTFIGEYNGRDVLTYDITPEEFGLPRALPEDLQGGDLAANVRIFEDILNGHKGPKRDIVVINAAYALYIAEKVKNITDGITLAQKSIDSGKAWRKLDDLKQFTNR
ncbi:MAG: anthranilate phosphoribosyltransferase [Candidatus Omnitrophica bacterium]|nr:anthranilate phosphoribosyltransferase [Candidatus Omnitrophota bacterium]